MLFFFLSFLKKGSNIFLGRLVATLHSIDDTLKQLKSTSDFLKYSMAKYKFGVLGTLMKLRIPCVSTIDNCLGVCSDHRIWKFVEARTCIIPTTIAEKKQCINVLEFLAFLKDVVEESLDVIDQLENESLGYVELDTEALVKDYFL